MFDLKKTIAISLTCLASAYAHATLTLPQGMLSEHYEAAEKKAAQHRPLTPDRQTEEADQLQAYYEWFEEPVYQLVC